MAKGNPNPKTEHLQPYQFKKGQIPNPFGRSGKGISLKERAKKMLAQMDDKEAEAYLNGLDKRTLWEMAEGKAKQDMELSGEITKKVISVDE